mgnify:CR=1 FL=1
MQIMSLITALPGAAAQGLIWGIMAIGVYITFRILDIADLTVDGTLCTGGAVCIMMMLSGHNVWVSMLVAQEPDFWRSCHRYFSYLYGIPATPCRNPDTVISVFRKPENHGKSKSGNQR